MFDVYDDTMNNVNEVIWKSVYYIYRLIIKISVNIFSSHCVSIYINFYKYINWNNNNAHMCKSNVL